MQRPSERVVGVSLDTEIALDCLQLLQALVPVSVELLRNLTHLGDLHLEALVFSLLALVSFDCDILENIDLFLQVALDIVTLSVCNRFNSVLLALQLAHFLASKGNLLP